MPTATGNIIEKVTTVQYWNPTPGIQKLSKQEVLPIKTLKNACDAIAVRLHYNSSSHIVNPPNTHMHTHSSAYAILTTLEYTL